MRATEFLNEVDTLSHDNLGVGKSGSSDTVTITIPRHLLDVQAGHDHSEHDHEGEEECCDECGLWESDCMCDEEVEESLEEAQEEESVEESVEEGEDAVGAITRLAGVGSKQPQGDNHTIAKPAGPEVPADPVFISPLQQQLELQKQQGGKESPIIDQIIDPTTLGSTAGEQPEQSVYHDSPLKDNEFVGAGTGAIDNLKNSTTTKGATKPWYKL